MEGATINTCLIAIILILVCATVHASEMPTIKPERVGISGERIQQVERGKIVGLVTAVARDGKVVYFNSVGNNRSDDPRPLAEDDLFWIYSMIKPITASSDY